MKDELTYRDKIFNKIEMFLEDNNIGLMVFPRELVAELTDRLIALEKQIADDITTHDLNEIDEHERHNKK